MKTKRKRKKKKKRQNKNNPYYKDLDATIVAQIHAAGFKVYTWTVNTPEDLKNTKILGVDAVFTNYPDRTF